MRLASTASVRLNVAHPNRKPLVDPIDFEFETEAPLPTSTYVPPATEAEFIDELVREFDDLESGRLYCLYGERVA